MMNNNCDGNTRNKCTPGEVRCLPITPGGHTTIICRNCFKHEMDYRRMRNLELGDFAQFDIPTWESLHVYDPEKMIADQEADEISNDKLMQENCGGCGNTYLLCSCKEPNYEGNLK